VQNTVQEPVHDPSLRPLGEGHSEAHSAPSGLPLSALPALSERERSLCSGINPWLAPLAMVLTQDVALRGFFRGGVEVLGAEHLPRRGPLLLAPTHRSRWDALMLPRAAGCRVTGRHCRFMVSSDEMVGLQGWFLHRLGCFPVNPRKPAAASLRFAVDLLQAGQQLVVFPEGRIQQDDAGLRLMPGLARLAALAEGQGVAVPVLPVGIAYSHARPRFGDRAALCFGPALRLQGSGRAAAAALNAELAAGLERAEHQARARVGRPLGRP
jgi:1-acyl-sn-glycerol-3-phosphate acyltransferase